MKKDAIRQLAEPFPEFEISWRIAQLTTAGPKVLAYVDARAVLDRLDEVVGPANWKNEYGPNPAGEGLLCRLSVRVDDEWIYREDVGGQRDSQGNSNVSGFAEKAAASDALKRAAVGFGIGRYLYRLGDTVAAYTKNMDDLDYPMCETKKGYRWRPPRLPYWAINEEDTAQRIQKIVAGLWMATMEGKQDAIVRTIVYHGVDLKAPERVITSVKNNLFERLKSEKYFNEPFVRGLIEAKILTKDHGVGLALASGHRVPTEPQRETVPA